MHHDGEGQLLGNAKTLLLRISPQLSKLACKMKITSSSLADRRHAAVSLVPLSGFEEGKALTYQDPKPTASFQPSILWRMPGPVRAYVHDIGLREAAS